MNNEYADRDIMGQRDHYAKHVQAMTSENLHCKSDIAAELAHRDIRIAEIEKDKSTLLSIYKQFESTIYDCTITDEEAVRRLLVHLEQSFNIVDLMVQELSK